MSFCGRWNTVLLAAALWAAAGGCSPMDSNPLDEEKESHYVLGKSRVNAMDYEGALQAFDEALEANPHSAQAHYQMAMLYENQDSVADPAAAIYHYEQYLKYDPKANNADLIAQRITGCKQKLAENVLQLPSAPATQQQLEKLAEENHRLHDQLAQWQAYAAQLAARTNPPAPQINRAVQLENSALPRTTSLTPEDVTTPATATGAGAGTSASTGARATATASSLNGSPPARVAPPRTHLVLKGETLASIARKQGVNLIALEEANPSVNPKKLRAGQVLNLPAP